MRIKVNFDAAAVTEAMVKAPDAVINQMRRALNESCRLVHRGALERHRFTSRTGQLERAISFRVNMNKAEGVVRINNAVAPYGAFVHNGTKKHDIFPKKGKMIRFIATPGTARWRMPPYGRFFKGSWCYAFGVTHPGTKPDKFLYEAAERSRGEINAIFQRHANTAIREAGL